MASWHNIVKPFCCYKSRQESVISFSERHSFFYELQIIKYVNEWRWDIHIFLGDEINDIHFLSVSVISILYYVQKVALYLQTKWNLEIYTKIIKIFQGFSQFNHHHHLFVVTLATIVTIVALLHSFVQKSKHNLKKYENKLAQSFFYDFV